MDRPDPGWYPDPEQPGGVRYYDGERWTDHRRATAPSAPTEDGLPPGDAPRAEDHSASPASPTDPTDTAEPAAGSAGPTVATASSDRANGSRRSNGMMLVLAAVAVLVLAYLASTFVDSGSTGDDDGAGSAEPTDPSGDAPSTEDPDDAAETADDAPDDLSRAEAPGDEASGDEVQDDTAAQEPDEAVDEGPDPADDAGAGTDADGVDFELSLDPEADHLATIVTSEGTITVALDAAGAPLAANNLASLAEDGYYDGVLFHRVIESFVIQAGDPTGTGSGGPGYRFDDELETAEALVAEHGGYPRGTLAMANAGPDTNGSQFFIVHGELVQLEPLYTVFGEVVEGMDVVDAIATTPTDNADRPTTDITIESIEVTTTG